MNKTKTLVHLLKVMYDKRHSIYNLCMIKCLFLLLISFDISAQANITPVLPELSKTFQNTRDFTLYKSEAYFSAQSTLGDISVIIRIEKIKNQWSNPTIATFSGKHHDLEPFISPDGLRLFFASNRPASKTDKTKDYDIWYVTRDTIVSDWNKPINMGNNINSENNEFYPSLSRNKNLYFTANKKDSKGKDDIYFSQYKQGTYLASYSIDNTINTSGDEYNAFIAPDESYLIFGAYNRSDSIGSGDMYISFKNSNNTWTNAKNLGPEINSKRMDYCPFVDTDTNSLYFTSKRSNLDQGKFNNINELANSLNIIENGMSRIYKINFTNNSTISYKNFEKQEKL